MIMEGAAMLMLAPNPLRAQESGADVAEAGDNAAVAVAPKRAIELGATFADNMILQRDMDVPVWGWSKPGTKITVEFGQQKESATAGKDGKWMLKLKPLKASAVPAEMVISDSNGRKVVLVNVLVGEVWMASGQSNMQWIADKCDVAALLKRVDDRVKAGQEKQPIIREFGVTDVVSALHPIEHAAGAWSSGDAMGKFSAVATAFAYELYKELGVPVGILNCSFSQTSIQAWTPRVGFRDGKDEYTQAIYRKTLETDPTTPEHKAAWDKFYKDREDALVRNSELVKAGKQAEKISTKVPGNMADNRDASWMFNGKLNPVIPYAIRGAIWNQGYANIGEGFMYYNSLHSLIRGWRERWGRDFPVCFHQFYAPGADDSLSFNPMAEMRLGAWQARDIPNVGMACQIDITGAIHYSDKALPGKRLALQALKTVYGKKIVADGPMFKSYEVNGDKLVVTFDFADGGLQVGKTITGKTLDGPELIADGDGKVTLFYLADKDRVWHRATMKIAGEKVVLTAAGVTEPHGVAYACNGVGGLPNLYNQAMLPMAPFIYYDNKLVISSTWPDPLLQLAGARVDTAKAAAENKKAEYRKMPLLGQMFRNNAVLQAGMPVTVWGTARPGAPWRDEPASGKAEIKFSFCGIEKTIPVTPEMREWQVVLPPMEASAKPNTLKVSFSVDGEVLHERVCTNIVFGDVWYVAGADAEQGADGNGAVRVLACRSKEYMTPGPRRYSVSVSTSYTKENRFGSFWMDAKGGLVEELGNRIHAKTGKPVGIVCMGGDRNELKHWMGLDGLKLVPSLKEDYRQLAGLEPGTEYYNENVRKYLAAWKTYWAEYIPRMMTEKRVPDGKAWGIYPAFASEITTDASQGYNLRVHCFWPASFKGIIFLTGKAVVEKDQGAAFGEQLSALANSWKDKFGCPDPCFLYTIPSSTLAPSITKPQAIKGRSAAVEIGSWTNAASIQGLIEKAVELN
jgi:hypothetical protein